MKPTQALMGGGPKVPYVQDSRTDNFMGING